jgi:hypothetical protein
VASFTCINYGLYKIDPEYFRYTALPNLFTFIYYSFYNLFNSLQEIPPNKAISQAFSMTESFLSLFLVAIFVSLLLSVRSQRDSEEINEAIHEFEKQGNAMENLIREEYKLDNIEAAIAELNRLKAGLVNFIYQLSKSID